MMNISGTPVAHQWHTSGTPVAHQVYTSHPALESTSGLGNQTKLVTTMQLLPCGWAAIEEHLTLNYGGNWIAVSNGLFDEHCAFYRLNLSGSSLDEKNLRVGPRKLLWGFGTEINGGNVCFQLNVVQLIMFCHHRFVKLIK